ncbi:ribonuclease P protein component [Wenyingzhuangia sp. IMCC45574]
MRFTLGKNQKLKSRKAIAQLFIEGKSVKEFPIKMIYLPVSSNATCLETKVAFSVPKRNFKLAVDRNRIKRLLREAYRLNQHEFFLGEEHYNVMFIYMSSKMPTYAEVDKKLKKLLLKFKS